MRTRSNKFNPPLPDCCSAPLLHDEAVPSDSFGRNLKVTLINLHLGVTNNQVKNQPKNQLGWGDKVGSSADRDEQLLNLIYEGTHAISSTKRSLEVIFAVVIPHNYEK